MYKLFIVGISDDYLTDAQMQAISTATLLVGTRRFTAVAQQFSKPLTAITPISKAIESIADSLSQGHVCVLASGDPLFYGIGKLLLKTFSSSSIEILPALSAVQRACALFKLSWDDADIITLHGRNTSHQPGRILVHRKSIIFTDAENSPEKLCREIIHYLQVIGDNSLLEEMQVYVAEDLGMNSQKVSVDSLEAIAAGRFSPLNIICFEQPEKSSPSYSFGLQEDSIAHSRGLITKNEIRAATIHQLQLPARGVFWDIGAGSGSISIEAARNNPDLTVFAVERKGQEYDNIKNNIVQFGCYNVLPVLGEAPASLELLPNPDCVFIGGSGGALKQIVGSICARNGTSLERLVINGVTEKTIQSAPEILRGCGFRVNTSTISVHREDDKGKKITFNPITVITGTQYER